MYFVFYIDISSHSVECCAISCIPTAVVSCIEPQGNRVYSMYVDTGTAVEP